MKRIFISYRNSDGRKDANRLAEDLSTVFGDDQVFYDKRDLQGGSSWREVIDAAIGAKPVVLLVLSPDFFGARHTDGRRRLDDDDDPVRQELAFALQSRATVMPLRGEGVDMPLGDTLPPELRAVTERHAPRLRTEDWRQDFPRLVDDLIRQGLEPARNDWRSLFGGAPPPRSQRWVFGTALGFVALAGVGTWWSLAGGNSPSPDPHTTTLIASAPPARAEPPASTAASATAPVPRSASAPKPPASAPRPQVPAPSKPALTVSASKLQPVPAAPRTQSPSEACGYAGVLDPCMHRKCNDASQKEFFNHPECVKLRKDDFDRTNLLR